MGGNPSRIPGIVVQPVTGVVVHPRLQGGVTLECPVSLRQVAPTILKALALSPQSLDAVRLEGSKKLPDDPTCD
jgi:hypothetical protein